MGCDSSRQIHGQGVVAMRRAGTSTNKCGCRPQVFVQINVLRMVRQLRSPKSVTPRSWTPELRERVEELATKLEANPLHRSKVHPPNPAKRHAGAVPATGGRAEEPELSHQQECRREEPDGNVVSV